MSAALFERTAGGRHHALSAGTAPAERVHPEVVQAMRESGFDVSHRRPRLLTHELAAEADVVVTRGLWRRVPVHSWEALHRLEAARPQGQAGRGGPSDP